MTTTIAEREQYRLMMLKALYEETKAGYWKSIQSVLFFKKMIAIGIPKDEVDQAFTWLEREGLATSGVVIGGIGITHAGIRAYEDTQSRPPQGTAYFPASVINNTYNFHAPVGGVQTGSHSTQNIAQQVNNGAQLLDLIGQVRAETTKLDGEAKSEAIELVDTLEEQAKSPQPRMALVKRCAEGLKDHMPWVVPMIQLIVELFLKP